MKKAMLVGVAALAATAAANADVTIEWFGSYTMGAGEGFWVESTPLQGTLVRVTLTANFTAIGAFSWGSDLAVTVDSEQWNGYQFGLAMVNGATVANGNIPGFLNNDTLGTFSGSSSSTVNPTYNGETAIVGFGNGYEFVAAETSLTVDYVSITLHGVDKVPAPGALALLGLAGVTGNRRRRN